MKKWICLLLAVMMMLTGAAALAETAPEETAGALFTPGTYSAEAQGIFAMVKVQITVTEDAITNVLITAKGETPELAGWPPAKWPSPSCWPRRRMWTG